MVPLGVKGVRRKKLIDQYAKAYYGVSAAREALAAAAPVLSDYANADTTDGYFLTSTLEHNNRCVRLSEMLQELGQFLFEMERTLP